MTALAAVPMIGSMQPTITTTSIRPRRALAAGLLAATLLLAGCGGGSDDEAGDAGTPETTAADSGTDMGTDSGTDTTEATDDGTPDADVCGTITAEDIAAIVPDADPLTATATTAIPTPTCDYTIEIGDDSFSMPGAIVSIQWAGDAAFYEAQKELQAAGATEVAELDEGFAFDEGGTILLTTDSGTWTVIQGVEIDKAATRQVTPEELVEVAVLVQDRL
jgi:hypothetical protein